MAFLNPRDIIRQLPIMPNDVTVDIGAGAGVYSIELAQMYKSNKIYAIDKNSDLLDLITHNATMLRLNNIVTIEADVGKGIHMEDMSVDSALVINIMHALDMDRRAVLLSELYRICKPHSYIIVIDWSQNGKFGPRDRVISRNEMIELLEKNNFNIVKDISAGNHHYGLMIEKK